MLVMGAVNLIPTRGPVSEATAHHVPIKDFRHKVAWLATLSAVVVEDSHRVRESEHLFTPCSDNCPRNDTSYNGHSGTADKIANDFILFLTKIKQCDD